MSTLEDKAVSMLDGIGQMAAEVVDRFTQLAQQYGQAVVDMGLAVVRVEAASHLLVGLLFTVLGVVCLVKGTVPAWKAFRNNLEADHPGWFFLGCVCSVPTVVFGVLGFNRLFELWNWVGLVYPELWIAHRILEGLMSK